MLWLTGGDDRTNQNPSKKIERVLQTNTRQLQGVVCAGGSVLLSLSVIFLTRLRPLLVLLS